MKTQEITEVSLRRKRKWFYDFQDQIKNKIEENNYSRHGYCLYQEITPNRYFECWDLQHNETGKITQMIFVGNRQSGFLFSYNSETGI